VRFLVLRLEAPLLAFGDVAVDELRPTLELPTASMLTGLFANALGFDLREPERHERLQERLVFAARADHPGRLLRDYQTARLRKDTLLWTTRGRAERRAGGGTTWDEAGWGTVQRQRFYRADALVTVVATLCPEDEAPTPDALRTALGRPERPLFFGRKSCLPARPLLDRHLPVVEAESAREALFAVPLLERGGRARHAKRIPCRWPVGDGAARGVVERWIADLRDWSTGLHVGGRFVHWGALPRSCFRETQEAAA
jgi:CRISPR system Cascade subunit CasD